MPALPFRVLDAPRLRDDFYCSTLAYSDTCGTLAVGLGSRVYLWSEELGVSFPPLISSRPGNYVTSMSFSSTEGGKAILAVGRQNGLVSLMSPLEEGRARFQMQKSYPVSCLAFKPTVTTRPSATIQGLAVACEDLLVGDDIGDIHYYSIEWPSVDFESDMPIRGQGKVTLLAKIAAHAQQICGLAWSPDAKYFASGGNDNAAHLFELAKILNQASRRPRGHPLVRIGSESSATEHSSPTSANIPANVAHLHSPPTSPTRRQPQQWPILPDRHLLIGQPDEAHPVVEVTDRALSAPLLDSPGPQDALPTPPISPTRDGDPLVLPSPRLVRLPSMVDPQRFSPTGTRRSPSPPPSLVSPRAPPFRSSPRSVPRPHPRPAPLRPLSTPVNSGPIVHGPGLQTHAFPHSAAVKALAFAPWQPSLLATGGGSNDRQIHFFHTGSGATLALINVFAQVTSLNWSKTKREVCATFGYAQPEHGIRIAVFKWPSCQCVVSIPWGGNTGGGGGPRTGPGDATDANGTGGNDANATSGRALWAVAFPGGPNDDQGHARSRRHRAGGGRGAIRGGNHRRSQGPARTASGIQQREGQRWGSRTQQEGCIVVAGSDESVKFHEVWVGEAPTTALATTDVDRDLDGLNLGFCTEFSAGGHGRHGTGGTFSQSPLGTARGVLGGSPILEASHGIDPDDLVSPGTGYGPGFGSGIVDSGREGRIGDSALGRRAGGGGDIIR